MTSFNKNAQSQCPCGAQATYQLCCARFIEDAQKPDSAEHLMRSRYSAFAVCNESYLLKTWHANSRPTDLPLIERNCKWLGLQVLKHVPQDNQAQVEFIAKFKINGRAQCLHEVSNFVLEQGQWFYVDGVFVE